jgi:hypothetical protein
MRKGSANTARGGERFVNETAGRICRAGAPGPTTVRADSGFWSAKVLAACRRHRLRYSITVRHTAPVAAAIAAIEEAAWVDITYPDGGAAQVELAIRDLKQGAGLRHCPSGRFLANAAWAVIATLAHNLLRWVAALGLGASGPVVAKTLRRRLLTLPGRLTRSARRRYLHLPAGWPWAKAFTGALARLQALPLLA